MTTEERLLRLENAFATLAQLAAVAESRANKVDGQIDALTELAARQDTRTADLERYFQMLTQLAVRADERMDAHDQGIAELRAAQLKLTEAQEQLTEAQERTEAVVAETNERLNSLINVVERFISEGRNGKS